MCGIAGFIDFSKNSSLQILQACTDMVAHRGPDGSGYEFIETNTCQVALGHRRLSILDLSVIANCPMWYKHYCLIYNGEIYNYAAIKDDLEHKGHEFITHGDTEVILHAFEEWGPQMLEKFIGMFAFVIYNKESNTIFACRDRAGVKPFFYYLKNGLFAFGSELKSLVTHPAFEKEIDLNAAAAFMQYGYVPAQHAIFKHTHKLKPGHYIHFDLNTQQLQVQQYWNVYDAYNKPTLKISLPDAIEETEKLLIN
ncbi:MAG: asparagine synthetase B, partial [Ferruginibacter sp.]